MSGCFFFETRCIYYAIVHVLRDADTNAGPKNIQTAFRKQTSEECTAYRAAVRCCLDLYVLHAGNTAFL